MAYNCPMPGNQPFVSFSNDYDWRGRSNPIGPIQSQLYRPRPEMVQAIPGTGRVLPGKPAAPPMEMRFLPDPFDAGRPCKNLIVNYLPQVFTDKHLFDLFVPYGPLHSVKIMREPKTGYSYGFGFVNFIKVEDAEEALKEVHGRTVGMNKRLKVAFARPPSDDLKNTNLYISNLPQNTTNDDILDMFGKFGAIVQRNILYDKRTGIPRGTAFVRFAHRDEASHAISCMNNFLPHGAREPIRVKLAQDHGRQKAALMAAGIPDGFHGGHVGGPFLNHHTRRRPGTCL